MPHEKSVAGVLRLILAEAVVEESHGELSAAIVDVVQRGAASLAQIFRSQQVEVGTELDEPAIVHGGVLQIDDLPILQPLRIDLEERASDDSLVSSDLTERLSAGKRFPSLDFESSELRPCRGIQSETDEHKTKTNQAALSH